MYPRPEIFPYLLGAGLLLASSAGQAAGGYSLDLSLGSAEQTTTLNGTQILSGSPVSWGLRMSAELAPNLSAQGGYVDYGELENTVPVLLWTVSYRGALQAWHLGLVGEIPVGRLVAVRIGAAAMLWQAQVSERNSAQPGVVTKDAASGVIPGFSVGINTNVGELSVGLEYAMFDLSMNVLGISVRHQVSNLGLVVGAHF